MNDFFEKVMTFINENTYLLIGICVFLIFVLIGYLIDNSVKSKRVRKDIKNKDQVPENIKNEIIKEAMNENKEKIMENSFQNVVREESEETKIEDTNLDNKNSKVEEITNMELDLDKNLKQEDLNTSFELDKSDMSTPISLEDNSSMIEVNNNGIIDESLIINSNNSETTNFDNNIVDIVENVNENSSDSIIDTPIELDLFPSDPDANIMNQKTENQKYKNDKKLSEILLNVDKERVNNINKESSPILEESTLNIEINSGVEKNEEDSIDELDKIMKKLSSMNNNEDDNYTNIF